MLTPSRANCKKVCTKRVPFARELRKCETRVLCCNIQSPRHITSPRSVTDSPSIAQFTTFTYLAPDCGAKAISCIHLKIQRRICVRGLFCCLFFSSMKKRQVNCGAMNGNNIREKKKQKLKRERNAEKRNFCRDDKTFYSCNRFGRKMQSQ